jgi:hypothetical protein
MTDLDGQERERVGGFFLEPDHDLRERLPSDLRQYGDLYALVKGGTVVGVTDEYGTCHWAAEGWTLKSVEDLILNKDGSVREDVKLGATVR